MANKLKKGDFKAPDRPFRVFSPGRILLLCLVVSVVQYSRTGSVTWVTESFRWIENSVTGLSGNSGAASTKSNEPGGSWLAPASGMSGRVLKVADGDTITIVDKRGEKQKIRFFGIDSPEFDQAYYRAARNTMTKLVSGQTVTIDVKDTDRYGRTVGVVYVNGQNVNEKMVRSGYAWWYRRYDPENQALKEAQKQARAEGLGLWQDADPMPPWEWRASQR